MLLLDGPEHLRQRRLMLPPFHGERMRAYGETMREVAERHVAAWPVGRPFAVHPTMQAITLEIILRTVFGVEEPARVARLARADEAAAELDRPAAAPARGCSSRDPQGAKPRSPWGRVYALMAPVDALIHEQIADAPARTPSRATTSSRCCWPRATRTATRSPTPSCATS